MIRAKVQETPMWQAFLGFPGNRDFLLRKA